MVSLGVSRMPARFGQKYTSEHKSLDAKLLGSLGASKGGKERAKTLPAKVRKEIASKAAKIRWG